MYTLTTNGHVKICGILGNIQAKFYAFSCNFIIFHGIVGNFLLSTILSIKCWLSSKLGVFLGI